VNKALKTLNDDQSLSQECKERVLGMKCDVTSQVDRTLLLNKVAQMYGRLDCLIINHASITHIGKQLEIPEEKFD
jgi:NAD(P)-dependent dehydrogenase (short-subunit alcohol dehydrogenase family)